jgi:hypothetical protein
MAFLYYATNVLLVFTKLIILNHRADALKVAISTSLQKGFWGVKWKKSAVLKISVVLYIDEALPDTYVRVSFQICFLSLKLRL